MSHPFHHLTYPETWATTLDVVSFSSLRTLEQCPRQWQLRRSRWPGFDRLPTRQHPTALEGTLVHEMLDRLFRELSFAGLPPTGSLPFRACLQRVDLMVRIRQRIDEANAMLAEHPRRVALRLPHDARALYNHVARLFQREYGTVDPAATLSVRDGSERGSGLSSRGLLPRLLNLGVLTECPVSHPVLPVRGVIDMVTRDAGGTRIIDFKTGHLRPEYEAQLALYALLWWRETGDLPVRLVLCHPRGRSEFSVDHERLEMLEAELDARIETVRRAVERTPADARTGDHCTTCDVRPFCDDYWQGQTAVDPGPDAGTRWIDLAVRVPTEINAHGFVAVQNGRRLPVVWEAEGLAIHGPFTPGEELRVVGAEAHDGGVKLVATTEVFHRGASPSGHDPREQSEHGVPRLGGPV